MEIVKEGSPNQEQYNQEIKTFILNFLRDDDFSVALFKTTLLFVLSLNHIQAGLDVAIEHFDDNDIVEFFKKEKSYYEAIFKSFKDRQEKLAK